MSFWTLGYAKASIVNLNNKANSPYPDSYQKLLYISKWVKEILKMTLSYVSEKKLYSYLFSDRKVTTFKKTLDLEAQIEYLKEKGTKYVVLDQLGFSSTYRYLYPTIERYPNKFKIIKELQNPNTYLMEFKPDLGYWGEWAEDKRNGYGTYNWEDGQKFEGH